MTFSKTLQQIADDFTRVCYKSKDCKSCPFYKPNDECASSKMDDLVRQAKEFEERSKTLLEGAQALRKVLGEKDTD